MVRSVRLTHLPEEHKDVLIPHLVQRVHQLAYVRAALTPRARVTGPRDEKLLRRRELHPRRAHTVVALVQLYIHGIAPPFDALLLRPAVRLLLRARVLRCFLRLLQAAARAQEAASVLLQHLARAEESVEPCLGVRRRGGVEPARGARCAAVQREERASALAHRSRGQRRRVAARACARQHEVVESAAHACARLDIARLACSLEGAK